MLVWRNAHSHSRRGVGYVSPWKVNHTNTEEVVALASPGKPRQFLSFLTDRHFIPGFLHVGTDDVGDQDQTILLCHVHRCLATSLTTTHQISTVPSSYEHQKTSLDIENSSPMDKLVAQECIHPDNNAVLSSETELTFRCDLLAISNTSFQGPGKQRREITHIIGC